ncbi:hypothetical protein QJQ45_000945 [Haematococcus lacustris]|nr:hypothetical protein QJQ45_000945 [Haematococcus lacustris]
MQLDLALMWGEAAMPIDHTAVAAAADHAADHHDAATAAVAGCIGIGHTTASVVMAQAFDQQAFPVDTHIHRSALEKASDMGQPPGPLQHSEQPIPLHTATAVHCISTPSTQPSIEPMPHSRMVMLGEQDKPSPKPKKMKPLVQQPSVDVAALRGKAQRILGQLQALYPDPSIPLNHTSTFQLLVASTDAKVNTVTPALFKLAPTPQIMARTQPGGVEQVSAVEGVIKVLGLAATKARNLVAMSQVGIGHKTASVVMAQAFGQQAFPVDTHIHRLGHSPPRPGRKAVDKGAVKLTPAVVVTSVPLDRQNVPSTSISRSDNVPAKDPVSPAATSPAPDLDSGVPLVPCPTVVAAGPRQSRVPPRTVHARKKTDKTGVGLAGDDAAAVIVHTAKVQQGKRTRTRPNAASGGVSSFASGEATRGGPVPSKDDDTRSDQKETSASVAGAEGGHTPQPPNLFTRFALRSRRIPAQ